MEGMDLNRILPTEHPKNQDENFESSEQIRQELSDFFIETLRSEKEAVENDVKLIKGIVSSSSIEAFKNLLIFSRSVQKLSLDQRVSEKDRMLLKVHLMDLSPIGATEIVPEVSSYTYAIKSIIEVLDTILTREISIAIHAYAEKIFLPPAQNYATRD